MAEQSRSGTRRVPAWVATYLAPLFVLVVVVGVVVALVLVGVLEGDIVRSPGGASPTTAITVLIEP